MNREDHMEIIKEEEEAAVDEVIMDLSMATSRFRRICVFCGSSQGKKKSYQDAAVELGEELVRLLLSPRHLVRRQLHHLSASFQLSSCASVKLKCLCFSSS